MLWKVILSLLAFFGGPHHQGPPLDIVDPVGPISDADIAKAHRAIHGPEGDMLFDSVFPDAGIKDTKLRWPGYPGKGVVPYVIHPSVIQHSDLILRAMEQYHKHTCIRFVKRKREWNYINIVDGEGCSSYVGMSNRNGQPVTLGNGCEHIGTVVHELGHAIGLYHEHQRSDRNDHVTIYKKNVIPDRYKTNFNRTKDSKELIYTRYDYNSIMHYGNYAFSKDPKRLMTIKAKNGQKLLEPYDKPGFTNSDIEMIKKLYKC